MVRADDDVPLMNARSSLVSLLLLAPTVHAGAFDPRQVPAGSPWIVHVDMEALSRSTILRALHADGVKFENDFDLDHVEKDFGLSPFDDLYSLTFYGSGKNGDESVCVVTGTAALSAAKSRLAAKGARSVRIGSVDALQIGARETRPFITLLPAQAGAPRIAIVAPSEAALASALLVLQGEAPTLANPSARETATNAGAKTPPSIRIRPNRGSLVLAACTPVARFEQNAAFLTRALGLLCEVADAPKESQDTFAYATRTFEFELSETQGDVQLTLAIDAQTPGKAKEMETLLRGSMTKSSLPADDAEVTARVTKLLAPLRFETLGSRLKCSYRYPSTGWVEDIHFVETARGLRARN
jgi:hypothetical protein